jgi:hypothetical protein
LCFFKRFKYEEYIKENEQHLLQEPDPNAKQGRKRKKQKSRFRKKKKKKKKTAEELDAENAKGKDEIPENLQSLDMRSEFRAQKQEEWEDARWDAERTRRSKRRPVPRYKMATRPNTPLRIELSERSLRALPKEVRQQILKEQLEAKHQAMGMGGPPSRAGTKPETGDSDSDEEEKRDAAKEAIAKFQTEMEAEARKQDRGKRRGQMKITPYYSLAQNRKRIYWTTSPRVEPGAKQGGPLATRQGASRPRTAPSRGSSRGSSRGPTR